MFIKLFKTDKKIIESIQFEVLEIIKVEFLNSAIFFNVEKKKRSVHIRKCAELV